ncbi:MAG: DUF4241 domain-containing protein, partial [Pseudomonadota bacterium]
MRVARHVFMVGIAFLALCTATTYAQDDPRIEPYRANLELVKLDDAALLNRALQRFRLGDLAVTSGAIVASDPLVQADRPAFVWRVEPGDYPIFLYRLSGVDPRVALAELRFSDEAPVHWRWAVLPGQDVSKLEDGFVFGYGVDAGTGGFYDADAWIAMQERIRREAEKSGTEPAQFDYYHTLLEPVMWTDDGVPVDIIHQPLDDNRVNMAIFSSGWGDGYYSTFWGIGASGEAVTLVTDFRVATNGDGREPGEQFSARMQET